jgi:hypothetical protein
MAVSAPEFTEDLLRFALLRTGNRRTAFELAQLAAAEVEAVAGEWRTRRHLLLWAARFVADRLEELPPGGPGGGDIPAELEPIMAGSSPRVRSAVALHCVAEFKLNELSQILRLRPKEIRTALGEAKQRMSRAGFSEAQVRERVGRIAFSAEEEALLKTAPVVLIRRRFGAERALGIAAVCLGVCMCFGWVVWERWRESPPVQMRAQMQRLLEASSVSGPGGIEKFEGNAAQAPDWLFLHGMEGVEVPERFASLKLESARIFDFNGEKMAQFTMEEPPGFLVVGSADSLGLGGDRAGSGRTLAGEWSGAWAVSGSYAFFLAAKDAEAWLNQLLQGDFVRQ